MTQESLFGTPEPYPWPEPTDQSPDVSSMHGIAAAMTWPRLTPAERCLAIFIGDGGGGSGGETALATALGIDHAELVTLLDGLHRAGFLTYVARWWA